MMMIIMIMVMIIVIKNNISSSSSIKMENAFNDLTKIKRDGQINTVLLNTVMDRLLRSS